MRPILSAFLLALVTVGCARVSVAPVKTSGGDGYEVRCTRERTCAKKAKEVCPWGVTLLEGRGQIQNREFRWVMVCREAPQGL